MILYYKHIFIKWSYFIALKFIATYTKVYLFKIKDETKSAFLKYKAEIENQLDLMIKKGRIVERSMSLRVFIKCCDDFDMNHGLSGSYAP